MTVNEKNYEVIRLLGKGKGGYSYLVTDGIGQYVLKQIHHEPCDYYTFGDKLASELRDYEILTGIGLPLPKLLEVDTGKERILKEYIDGETIDRHVLFRRTGEAAAKHLDSLVQKIRMAQPVHERRV